MNPIKRRALSLLVIGVLVMTFFVSVVAAADQVILDWEQDADGNPITLGQVIDDEYHSATGISVTVQTQSATNVAAIYPSQAPYSWDLDLGTPNETCPDGGPGIGDGGEVGQPGENCLSHGNILIVPTVGDADDDGFIDDLPDDEANGGIITLLFNEPVTVDYVEVIDMERQESLYIVSYSDVAGADVLDIRNSSGLGDNSYESIAVQVDGVRRLDFGLTGSGAISAVAFTPSDPSAVALSSLDVSAVAPTGVLVMVALLTVATAISIWFMRSRSVTSAINLPSSEQ